MGPLDWDWWLQFLAASVLTVLLAYFGRAHLWRWLWAAPLARPVLSALFPTRAAAQGKQDEDEAVRRAKATTESANQAWQAMGLVLQDPEYIRWQCETVALHHESFLQQLRTLGVNCLPTVYGTQYPVVCFRAEAHEVGGSFTRTLLGETPADALEADLDPVVELGESGTIPAWITANGRAGEIRTEYYRLLAEAEKVKRWNMRGFELSTMEINDKGEVIGGRAAQITYGQNCLTSHVLGYELYRRFLARDGAAGAPSELRPAMMLEPSGKGNHFVGPSSGADLAVPFHPMISVQAIVVFKDVLGKWRTLTMERSQTVAAMPGFWQFPPAGGFEIFGHEAANSSVVLGQFDLQDALIREFLEEVFNDVDLTSDRPGSRGNAYRQSAGFGKFYEGMSQAPEGSRPPVSLNFLGVVLDLVALRSEYSFLIVDEGRYFATMNYKTATEEWASWSAASSEAKSLEDLLLQDVVLRLSDPKNVWNPSSAGLFALFAELATDEHSWLRQQWTDMTDPQLEQGV